MNNQQTTLELLIKFVNQRPGLNFADYGDVTIYRRELNEIVKDRADFYELLSIAQAKISNFEDKLTTMLINSTNRLSLENGKLSYCTGQYFPTEYRPAANRIIVQLIWNEYRERMSEQIGGNSFGNDLRTAIRKNFGRRINKNYFN